MYSLITKGENMNKKLIKLLNDALEIQLMANDIGTKEAKAKADETWALAMKAVGDTAKTLDNAMRLIEQVNGSRVKS
jgi:hypothetical protein